MSGNTTMAIKKVVAQRLKRLKIGGMFVPNGLIFEKLLERMTDPQLQTFIEGIYNEQDLKGYNYIKPKPPAKPKPFIYSEPSPQ